MRTTKDGAIVGDSWQELGIYVPSGSSGQAKVKCPNCENTRKPENRGDKPLSVNLDGMVANCHNCGQEYIIDRGDYTKFNIEKEYKRPELEITYDNIGDKPAKWFMDVRSISLSTLKQMKVTSGVEWMPKSGEKVNVVKFNYFYRGELINIKYRDGEKGFRMYGGAKLIFYNLDVMLHKEYDSVVIVEGEIDALSMIEAGVANVISVPNGASKGSMNLEYLNNNHELFDNEWRKSQNLKPMNNIILAIDDDEAGRALRSEFVRRFGAERCSFVDYRGCNDPNEVLTERGKLDLFNVVDMCTPAPLTDVITVSDISDRLSRLHKEGLKPGDQVGSKTFREHYSFEEARLTIITGVSTHGKSEFLDDIATRLAIDHNWSFAVFSPENFPIEYHVSKLVSKFTGKEFNEVTGMELEDCYDFISKHFYWIYPEDDNYRLDNILRINDLLISRYGVRGLIIDPWTEVDKQGKTGTEDINDYLSLMNRYKREKGMHIFLVAHPTKMGKDDNGNVIVPDLMDISGSANFYNKADGGITVYRLFGVNEVKIYINKVKFKHLGRIGKISMSYNIANGRYEDAHKVESEGWDDANWLHQDQQLDMFDPKQGEKDLSEANIGGMNATIFVPENNDELPF
jgi:twinkle protein